AHPTATRWSRNRAPNPGAPAMTRARASSNESFLAAAAIDAPASPTLFPQSDLADHHRAIDRLQHVVDGERGHGHRGQSFHLHAGGALAAHARLDADRGAVLVQLELEIDSGDVERMRQRDQLARALD